MDCIFCKIVAGEIPSTKIYEDENFLAFLDIKPVSSGHTLLVPKKHYTNIFDADPEVLKGLAVTGQKIARAVKEGVGASGVNYSSNNGAAAGQVVFHLHQHIIPRSESDGLRAWSQREYGQGEAEQVAKSIIEKLQDE